MTSREHLYFYSELKGLPAAAIPSVVEAKLQQFGLKIHEHNYAANLSGGNKRKLMAACALIGDPPIILADEPSAGMDPVARRFMWGMIKNVATRRKRSSVLLSTHSMEECEALCSRSAILVNGVFRCLGTNSAICERYGGGYDLMIKVQRPTRQELQQMMDALQLKEDHKLDWNWATATMQAQNNAFFVAALNGKGSPYTDKYSTVAPAVFVEWFIFAIRFHALHASIPKMAENVELVEWHSPMARYKLITKRSLGELFAVIEANKAILKVLEYSLSATTLEQIFNNFARHQEVSVEEAAGGGTNDATALPVEDLAFYVEQAAAVPLPADMGALQLEPGPANDVTVIDLGEAKPMQEGTPRPDQPQV